MSTIMKISSRNLSGIRRRSLVKGGMAGILASGLAPLAVLTSRREPLGHSPRHLGVPGALEGADPAVDGAAGAVGTDGAAAIRAPHELAVPSSAQLSLVFEKAER